MLIRDTAYIKASLAVDSAAVAEWSGLDQTFISEKIGVKSRRILSDDEDQVSLAVDACRRLFQQNKMLEPDSVEALVVVSQNQDYKIPHSSAIVQRELSLSKDTACFDINLGCSGYVYGLSILKGLMLSEGLENAILITSDPYSRVIGKADKDTVGIFGDAASATWLCAEKGAQLGRIDFGTDGDGASLLQLFSWNNLNSDSLTKFYSHDNGKGSRLTMNGRAIFNFMIKSVPESIDRCLEKNNTVLDDVDYFVFHQASKFLLEALVKKINLPPEKVPIMLESTGNTVSSSIPIVLSELKKTQDLSGKTVLISGFGVGFSWASNLVFYGV